MRFLVDECVGPLPFLFERGHLCLLELVLLFRLAGMHMLNMGADSRELGEEPSTWAEWRLWLRHASLGSRWMGKAHGSARIEGGIHNEISEIRFYSC